MLLNFDSAMDRFSISRLLESASVEPSRAAPLPVGGIASGVAAATAGEAAGATCEQQALLWALAALSSPQAPASAIAPAQFALPTGPNPNASSSSSPLSSTSSSSSASAAAAIDPQALSYLTYLAYFLSQIGPTPLSDASFCATPTSGSFSSSSSSVSASASACASLASSSASASVSAASPTAAGSASGACFSIGDLYGLAAAAMLCPEQTPRTPMECTQTQPLFAAPADLLRSPASTATERSQLVGSESGCTPDWSAVSAAVSGTVPSRLQRKQLHQQQHQQQLFYQTLLYQQVRLTVYLICV